MLRSEELVLVQHLPDVEIRRTWRLSAEVVCATLLEDRLELAERLAVAMALGLRLVLRIVPAHILERVADLDHGVADVVDLAEQLVVEQPSLVAAAVEAKLVADEVEAGIRLANDVAATLHVWQICQRRLLQDFRLRLPEPVFPRCILVVRVLDTLILEDHPEDRAEATDLPIAEVELQRWPLLGLGHHLLHSLGAKTVAAHPLVVRAVVAFERDFHRRLGAALRLGDGNDLGSVIDSVGLGLDPHALLQVRVVIRHLLGPGLASLLRRHGCVQQCGWLETPNARASGTLRWRRLEPMGT
mmetsp:Transcript_141735/g.353369  ORF Transcript_141735/g.353369 Transcript_141735/m.353369 type:complete len:300 (-) Transcript_141735:2-901(-)